MKKVAPLWFTPLRNTKQLELPWGKKYDIYPGYARWGQIWAPSKNTANIGIGEGIVMTIQQMASLPILRNWCKNENELWCEATSIPSWMRDYTGHARLTHSSPVVLFWYWSEWDLVFNPALCLFLGCYKNCKSFLNSLDSTLLLASSAIMSAIMSVKWESKPISRTLHVSILFQISICIVYGILCQLVWN